MNFNTFNFLEYIVGCGILNSEPFQKNQETEKKKSKKQKTVCFTFNVILKDFLRTNYMGKTFWNFFNNKGLLIQILLFTLT